MTRAEDRREITDVRRLAALAHPLRTALLSHLLAVGPRTASECAAAVDASPSNCSWHLRQLEKHGFVERAGEAADGRERPWRAAATGFRLGPTEDTPAIRSALQTLATVQLDEEFRLVRSYLRHEDELAEPWRHSAEFNTYGLLVDPAELAELAGRLDAVIRPYLAATRTEAPATARPVHVFLSAFLRPDAPPADAR
jgi:DNA-binding transcriptional ArsR family regulator